VKDRTQRSIHWINQLLNKPVSVIVVLLLLFAYFAYGNAQFQRDNRTLIQNTSQTSKNTNTIIKNLEKAVSSLKSDNERQTRYIKCLLAINGRIVDDAVDAQCQKMADNIGVGDVTKTTLNQTPEPNNQTNTKTTPTLQNTNTTTNNTQDQNPAPGPIKQILGLPVCVPVTNICLR
jgi:hypothetical protein